MSPVHAPALSCATTDGWALSHTWQAESDRSALALTREVLGRVGIDLVDARDGAPPSAVKMHAMEMADALHTGSPRLQDLSAVAQAAGWAGTLPHFVQRNTSRKPGMFGTFGSRGMRGSRGAGGRAGADGRSRGPSS